MLGKQDARQNRHKAKQGTKRNRARVLRRSYWASSSLLIFDEPTSVLLCSETVDFLIKETTTAISSFQDYKQALSNFDAKCMEISRNTGSDCSVEFECSIKRLEITLGMSPTFFFTPSFLANNIRKNCFWNRNRPRVRLDRESAGCEGQYTGCMERDKDGTGIPW